MTEIIYNELEETKQHVKQMNKLIIEFAKYLKLSEIETKDLLIISLLHDIGKKYIPKEILNKTEKLSINEWEVLKSHSIIGYELIKDSEFKELAVAIKHHHERFDGNGYPDKLKGKEIPLYSRIISIVDSFEAMTGKRIYKNSLSISDSLKEIEKCSNTQFDPCLAKKFIKMLKLKYHKKVLIIDDSKMFRKIIFQMLNNDYNLYFANDGQKGFKLAIDYIPDIIIMDCNLPSIQGYTLINILKEHAKTQHVKIIFTTDIYTIEHLKNSNIDIKADYFLPKNEEYRKLNTIIKELTNVK